MRSKSEIDEQIERAIDENGVYFGMSYEEGVVAALDWVIGFIDEKPIPIEEIDTQLDEEMNSEEG